MKHLCKTCLKDFYKTARWISKLIYLATTAGCPADNQDNLEIMKKADIRIWPKAQVFQLGSEGGLFLGGFQEVCPGNMIGYEEDLSE